jgi:hypothetical protein
MRGTCCPSMPRLPGLPPSICLVATRLLACQYLPGDITLKLSNTACAMACDAARLVGVDAACDERRFFGQKGSSTLHSPA